MRQMLIYTVGAPGSGKSTTVRAYLAAHPGDCVRASRDDLRKMIGCGPVGDSTYERVVTDALVTTVNSGLAAGKTVIIDTTGYDRVKPIDPAIRWQPIADAFGAQLMMWDFQGVPLSLCLANNRKRAENGGRNVPESAIREICYGLASICWENGHLTAYHDHCGVTAALCYPGPIEKRD